ncbi:uncharacterized protein CDAR_376331 [Caerostris darwini]|uniref:Uncharacterized protein n=1 Tax=Caerostris darwini TaxID=1538125 RepID=A0AAV4UYA4_9ARAC|nr:uncharacterized protein CDAR_376331 [Caerostris darwini]
MLCSAVPLWLFLLAVSADSFNSFHKIAPTEKPDIPYEDSPLPKPRKPPTHISEFTDPNTGLNPFLDIEEGPTSAGRNVMKDERREDPPFFDFELVEGDAPNRRFGFDMPKEPSEEPPIHRWPPFEDSINKDPVTTTLGYFSEAPPTTENSYVNVSDEIALDVQQTDEQKIKKAVTRSSISKDSIIYASATVVVVAAVALLFGVCWWRRKLKRTSQSPISAENGELKS